MRKGNSKGNKKKNNHKQQNATHLLGFIEEKEPQVARTIPRRNQKRDGYSKLAGNGFHSHFDKEKFVQASMKFVLKNPIQDGGCQLTTDAEKQENENYDFEGETPYLINLLDSNEKVNWRDVIQVQHEMVNSKDITCPICMEALENMVCPRITKCGHLYCWPCMLQYLDYENDHSWKRCPLCFDSVYKLDLKNCIIRQNKYFKAGNTIKFDLMVRAKGTTKTKNKYLESLQIAKMESLLRLQEESKTELTDEEKLFIDHVKQNYNKVDSSGFPNAHLQFDSDQKAKSGIDISDLHLPYQNNRMHLNTREYYQKMINKDMTELEKDYKYKLSSGEKELLPYVQDGIKQLKIQTNNLKKINEMNKQKSAENKFTKSMKENKTIAQ